MDSRNFENGKNSAIEFALKKIDAARLPELIIESMTTLAERKGLPKPELSVRVNVDGFKVVVKDKGEGGEIYYPGWGDDGLNLLKGLNDAIESIPPIENDCVMNREMQTEMQLPEIGSYFSSKTRKRLEKGPRGHKNRGFRGHGRYSRAEERKKSSDTH